jgi:hypothetical protein
MVEHFDPEGRKQFLRDLHRAPLRLRIREIFSDDPSWAQNEFAKIRRSFGSKGSFDKFTRYILRRCKKIEGENAERRRRAYVKAIIRSRLEEEEDEDDATWSPEEFAVPLLVVAGNLGHAAGLTEQEALSEITKLVHALIPTYGEHTMDRTRKIIRSACTKTYPLRYLRVVVQNEKRGARKKQGKAG